MSWNVYCFLIYKPNILVEMILRGKLAPFYVLAVMIAVICVFLIILALAYFYLNIIRPYKVLDKLPGPPRTFLLGHLPLLASQDGHKLTNKFMDWASEYGSPFLLDMVTRKTVCVSDAEQIEHILKAYTNLDKSTEYDLMNDWLGNGLLTGGGPNWHRRRRQLNPSFHSQILTSFIPIIAEQAVIFVDQLEKESGTDATVDVFPLLRAMTLDIICETMMGKQLKSQTGGESVYATALNRLGHYHTYRSLRPYLHSDFIWRLTKKGKEWMTRVQTLCTFSLNVIKEREIYLQSLESGGAKKRLALLDLMLEMKRTGDITLDEIREEVDTFIAAGHDTTMNSLSFALWCLAAHPEVQEKVFQEVLAQFGSDPDTNFTMESLTRLKYLDCVIKEVLRLFPPVAMVARRVDTGIDIGGYYVPPGTSLYLFLLMLHRNPKYFPDPLKFDPDRFLPENVDRRHAFAAVPFAAGPRNCIGQRFAMIELTITLAIIIGRFRLETEQTFEELNVNIEITMSPADGIHVKVFPRN